MTAKSNLTLASHRKAVLEGVVLCVGSVDASQFVHLFLVGIVLDIALYNNIYLYVCYEILDTNVP